MIALAHIICATSETYGIPISRLIGPLRCVDRISHARQVAFVVARRATAKSLPQIGQAFNRDHTTVLSGIDAVNNRADPDETLAIAAITHLAGIIAGDPWAVPFRTCRTPATFQRSNT